MAAASELKTWPHGRVSILTIGLVPSYLSSTQAMIKKTSANAQDEWLYPTTQCEKDREAYLSRSDHPCDSRRASRRNPEVSMPHLSARHQDKPLINAHFAACKAAQEPFVLCLRRRTWAEVRFDDATLEPSQRSVLEAHAAEIVDGAMAIITKHRHLCDRDIVDSNQITLPDVRLETAEAIAAELFAFYSSKLS